MPLKMERRIVSFEVRGVAAPKGSLRAFMVKGRKFPIVTHDNPRTRGWQWLVSDQAQRVSQDGLFVGPVALAVAFYLPRPASLPRHVRHHTKKPDLDKLLRCTKDALKGILYRDDSQVVDVIASKSYTAVNGIPRACISVAEAGAPEPEPLELF